jgi:hypothetical protein
MPRSNSERQKIYRERKIAELGVEEYKKQQREKAKARRDKMKIKAEISDPNVDPLVMEVIQAIREMKINVAKQPEFKEKFKEEAIEKAKISVEKFTVDQGCSDVIQSLINHNKKVGDTVKPRTLKSYFSKLKTLYNRYTGNVWDCKDFEWLRDTDKILNFIANHDRWKSTSKWGYINAVTSILSRVLGYDEAYKVYSEANKAGLTKYLNKREENMLSPEQEANIIPWTEVMKLLPPDDMAERVIFELVRFIPRRSGTYRMLTWRKSHSDEHNYVLMEKDKITKMILNKYKTSRTYGRYEVPVPAKLGNLISKYINSYDIPEDGYMFPDSKGREQNQGQFSRWVTDIMADLTGGKRMGTTLMRISYASYAVKKYQSVKQQKIVAQNLAHSLDQLRLYAKIDL